MFYSIGQAMVDSMAVDWIEWRKERFILHMDELALAFPLEYSGQANVLAKDFLKTHNGSLVNPAKINWAEHLSFHYVVYLKTCSHSITDAEQIQKLETWMNRKNRRTTK